MMLPKRLVRVVPLHLKFPTHLMSGVALAVAAVAKAAMEAGIAGIPVDSEEFA